MICHEMFIFVERKRAVWLSSQAQALIGQMSVGRLGYRSADNPQSAIITAEPAPHLVTDQNLLQKNKQKLSKKKLEIQ